MDSREEKFIKLTTLPIGPLVLRMAAPAIVGMLITAVYNAADSYFVSVINDSAVGSVGVVFSFMAVIQAFGFMFGHGAGNFMSRELGKKNYKDAGHMAVNSFVLAFFTGLVISAAGLVFLEPLAVFLGSTDTILPYAKEYLRFILLAAPFQTAALCLNNELRFQGNAKHGMIGLGFGALLNMALDPILISVCGMGVSGAGLATMTSQIIGFGILVFCTFRGGNMPVKLSRFYLTKAFAVEIFRGGVPSFMRQVIGSVATVLLNYALKPYSDNAIAAMTVVSRVMMIIIAVVIGVGQGFQPVCGMNYGAGNIRRVLKAFRFSSLFSTGVLLVGAVMCYVFAEPVVGFIAGEPASIEIGVRALRYQCLPMCLTGVYMMGSMMLQNLGRSLRATILAVARQGIVFIPLILMLPRFFGLTGAITAQPAADVISFMICMPLLIPEVRRLQKQAKEADV
jgi:putative MATE family efflux protein